MSFEDTSGLTQLISERGQAVDKLYEKTLLRWVNAKLQQGGDQNVDNLSTAWKDGTNLIRLVEILSGKQAPRYHRNVGKKSFLGLENINTAMKMMADDGLKSDISTREFQEGNQKAVLSVLWSLVHFYQLQKPFQQGGALASGGESSRKNLFDWLQNKTRGYNNVSIKDMHQSWFDGMGLLALIDQYDNSLLPNKHFEEIDPSRKSENLDLAFDLAERHLGIPRLLDTEDILSTNHSQIPNEECFMTYLSFFPMAFLDKEQGRTPSTTTSTTTTTTPTTRSTTTPSTATTSKQGAGSRIGGQQQRQQPQQQQKGLAVPRPPSPPPASKVEQARQLTPSTLKHTSIPIVTAPLSEQPVTSLQQQGQQQTLQKQQQRGQQLQRQQPLQQQQGRKVSPPRPPTPPEPAPQVPESQQITPKTLAESGYPSIVPTTPMEDAEEAKRIEEAKHPSAAAGGGGRISPRKQQPQRGPRAGARLAAGEGGGVVGQQQTKEGKKGGLMKKKKMARKEPISQPTTTPSTTTTTTTTSPTKQRGGLKPGFLLGKKGKAKEGVAPVVQEEEQPIGEATVFEIGRLPDRTELHEQRRQEKLERKRRKQLERQVMSDHIYAPSEEQQPLQQSMESGVPVREGGLAPQLSPMGKKRMSGGIAPGVVGGAAHPRTQQQRPIQETGERRRVAPVVEEEQPIGEATVFEIGRIPDITELHEQRRQEKLERKRRKRLEREVMTDHLYAPSEEQQPQQPLRETGEPIGEATVFEIGRIPDITEIHEQKRKEKLERKRRKQLERQVMTDHIYAPSEEQQPLQQPQQRAQQIQGVLGQKREMEREMFVTRRPQSLEEIRADIDRIRREARVAEEESRRIEADNEALRRQQPLLQQRQQPLYGDAAVEAEKKRIAYLKSYLAGLQSQTSLDPSRAALGDQQIRAELDEALLAKKRAKAERGRARREAAEAENERHKAEQRRIQAEREKLRAEAERLRAEEEKARVEGQVLARTLERLQAAQPSNISGITPLAETTRATTAAPTTTTTTMPSNISGVTPLAETTMMTTPTTTTTTPLSLKGKEKLREGVIEETGAGGKYLPESEARKAQGIRDRPAVGQII